MNIESVKEWVSAHKKQIVITAGIGCAVACAIIGYRHRDAIRQVCVGVGKKVEKLLSKAEHTDVVKSAASATTNIAPVVSVTSEATLIPDSILQNLSGEMMTATKLGDEILVSAQAINKRIVEKGLAVKCPDGSYNLTESGKLVGKDIWKTNRYGYSFSNIEWDRRILEFLFSPEELAAFEARKQRIDEIFTGVA